MSPRRARRRYIAFAVDGPRTFTRDEILSAIRSMAGGLWLVTFQGTKGLVRSSNLEKDDAIQNLKSLRHVAGEAVTISTLGTSGTIRAAVRKYIR